MDVKETIDEGVHKCECVDIVRELTTAYLVAMSDAGFGAVVLARVHGNVGVFRSVEQPLAELLVLEAVGYYGLDDAVSRFVTGKPS